MKNKNKILKILFVISFIPYILIFIYGLYGSIFGSYGMCIVTCPPKTYGIEAFFDNAFLGTLTLTFYGIIPIVLIYEVFYIIYFFVKKGLRK